MTVESLDLLIYTNGRKTTMEKPEMHPTVDKTPKSNDEFPLDLKEMAKKMAGVRPVVSNPHKGMGRKYFIQADSKSSRTIVELFTERLIPSRPSNLNTGYDLNDVEHFRGVMITSYEKSADKDGYHRNCGKIIPYDEFINRYVTDEHTRIILDRIMETMDECNPVDDNFLEGANSFWENREVGLKYLYKNRLH